MTDTKFCTKCEEIKKITDFYAGHTRCKLCVCLDKRNYRKSNLDKVRQQEKQSRGKYKKTKKECNRRWYLKNREKTLQRSKNRYIQNSRKIYTTRRNMLDDLKINGCSICGYNKCNRALSFHHVIPKEKNFHLISRNMSLSNEKIIDEFHKCILLCANCHREIEELTQKMCEYEKQNR